MALVRFWSSLIRKHAYGSVIQELDKEMIRAVPVPVVGEDIRKEIATAVLHANRVRDEAWKAEEDVIRELVERIEQS